MTSKEKVFLLNIDSRYRNMQPKNMISGYNISPTKIELKKDSDILKIYFTNSNIKIDDKIIIKNVKTRNETISQGLYFIKNFNYVLVYFPDHKITTNINLYNPNNQIEITDIDYAESKYSNIPINSLITKHNIILIENITLPTEFIDNVGITLDNLKKDYIAIKLNYFYVTHNIYDILPNLVKINRTEFGGIPSGYLNADFPVNIDQRQGYYKVSNSSSTFIEVLLPIKSYIDENISVNGVIIDKIESELEGYPDVSNYTIKLKKHMTNVTKIELVSTEIPNHINNISDINNKLYWQNLDDGKHEYSITIPSGNYTIKQLLNKMMELMNLVPRETGDTIKPYNIFDISFDESSQTITFETKKIDTLSNAITITTTFIDNQERNVLEIIHPDNTVSVNDEVKIENSTAISYVPMEIINQTHKVVSVNKLNNSYQIILPSFNQLEVIGTSGADAVALDHRSAFPRDGSGGEEIKVTSKNYSRLLFNKENTIGNILGFRDVGKNNAITEFLSKITNKDSYANENGFNLNVVGNPRNDYISLNLVPNSKYILLYINDYEEVITNTSANNCFAKIQLETAGGYRLDGNYYQYMFNRFVSYPIEFDTPIPNLAQLQVKLTYPDGTPINFGNINHSFTLKITESIYKTEIGKHNIDSKTLNLYKDRFAI